MERKTAELLAAQAFAWLASDDDLMGVFLGATGTSPDDLRDNAGSGEFLASVLDFLLMDDAWVTAFCDATQNAYTDPMLARSALPGGQQMHWT